MLLVEYFVVRLMLRKTYFFEKIKRHKLKMFDLGNIKRAERAASWFQFESEEKEFPAVATKLQHFRPRVTAKHCQSPRVVRDRKSILIFRFEQ